MKRNYAENVTDPTTGHVGPQISEVKKTTNLRRSRLRRRTSNGNDGKLARTRQTTTNSDNYRLYYGFFYDYFYGLFMEEIRYLIYDFVRLICLFAS